MNGKGLSHNAFLPSLLLPAEPHDSLLLWKEKKNMMLMVTHDVDEAIYMGTRVIVMAKAGGSILRDIPIDLEYPRKRLDPKFLSYREEIMRLLGVDQEEEAG